MPNIGNIVTTQQLTAAPTPISYADQPSGVFNATRLTLPDTTPFQVGGLARLTEVALGPEDLFVVAVESGTQMVVQRNTLAFTINAYVTALGRTNTPLALNQSLVPGSTGTFVNGSVNKAEAQPNSLTKDVKLLWDFIRTFFIENRAADVTGTELATGRVFINNTTNKLRVFVSGALRNVAMEDWVLSNILPVIRTEAPLGIPLPFLGTTVPTGWLLCDGATVLRATYPQLYAVIGDTYGANDGSTNFKLPNLKGLTLIGLDNMGGVAQNRVTSASFNGANASILGGVGGEQRHQLTTPELPFFNINAWAGAQAAAGGMNSNSGSFQSIFSIGNDVPHNNMQPYMALNYIVRGI